MRKPAGKQDKIMQVPSFGGEDDAGRFGGREGVYSEHFDARGPSSRALARRQTPLL